MKNRELYFLLEVVYRRGDARRLIHEGLDYKQIGELTSKAILDGLVSFDDRGELDLTTSGFERYKSDREHFKRTDKSLWIEPQEKSKIRQIDKNDIYLPREKDLSF
jgi:hypothetical protein